MGSETVVTDAAHELGEAGLKIQEYCHKDTVSVNDVCSTLWVHEERETNWNQWALLEVCQQVARCPKAGLGPNLMEVPRRSAR